MAGPLQKPLAVLFPPPEPKAQRSLPVWPGASLGLSSLLRCIKARTRRLLNLRVHPSR